METFGGVRFGASRIYRWGLDLWGFEGLKEL